MKVKLLNGRTLLNHHLKPVRACYEIEFTVEEDKTYYTSVIVFPKEQGLAEEFMSTGEYWHPLSAQAAMETPLEKVDDDCEERYFPKDKMKWIQQLLLAELPFLKDVSCNPKS